MAFTDGLQLRAMRLALGVSQDRLTAFIQTTSKTIRKYEREGTTNDNYVLSLLELVEKKGQLAFAPDLPRGPHAKRWHRFQPKRHYAVGRKRSTVGGFSQARYWLYLQSSRDHLHAIKEPPTGLGDMWLELVPDAPHGSTLRRRFVLREFGRQWVDDIDLSAMRTL